MIRSMFRRVLQFLRIAPREQPRPIPAAVQRHTDAGSPLHKSAQRPQRKQGIADYEVVPNHAAEGVDPFPGH
jgi:hypothetical protein